MADSYLLEAGTDRYLLEDGSGVLLLDVGPIPFYGNSANATPTAIDVTLPPNLADGSLALVLVGSNAAHFTTPSGWTLVAGPTAIATFNNQFVSAFSKPVGATDSGTSTSFALTTGSGRIVYIGAVIPNADAVTPLDGVTPGYFAGTSETSSSLTAPAVTPTSDDDVAVILAMRRYASAGTFPKTATPPAGFTEFAEGNYTSNPTGSVSGTWGAYSQLTGQAGVSQGTKAIALDAPSNGSGWIFLVKPTVAAGGSQAASGTIPATSAVTGAVGLRAVASGTVAAVSAVTGAVTELLPTTGTVAATGATTGAVTTRLPSGGSIAAVTGTTGAIGLSQPVSGTIPATSGVTGAVTAKLPTTGTVAAVSSVSGSASIGATTQAASGTIAATSTVSGSVGRVQAASGTVAATATTSGTVTAQLPTSGTNAATTGSTGDVAAILSTSGTVDATTDTTGTITTRLPVAGELAALSDTVGEVTLLLAVSGSVDVVSGATGREGRPRDITFTATLAPGWSAGLTGDQWTARLRGRTISAHLEPVGTTATLNQRWSAT